MYDNSSFGNSLKHVTYTDTNLKQLRQGIGGFSSVLRTSGLEGFTISWQQQHEAIARPTVY
jgi:hypothetical protein